MAAVDGMPDESERRVIRAYAMAWGVDDEKLDFWMWGYEQMNTSLTRALWLKLRGFVLSSSSHYHLRRGSSRLRAMPASSSS